MERDTYRRQMKLCGTQVNCDCYQSLQWTHAEEPFVGLHDLFLTTFSLSLTNHNEDIQGGDTTVKVLTDL